MFQGSGESADISFIGLQLTNDGDAAVSISKIGIETESGSGEIRVNKELGAGASLNVRTDEYETNFPALSSRSEQVTLEVYADGEVITSTCAAHC